MSQSNGNIGNGRFDALEQRVNRLEDAVAAVQDTRQLEDRLVERVTDRVGRRAALPVQSPSLIVDSRRSASPPIPALSGPIPTRQRWLILDVYNDVRTIGRMFFDPNYRVSPGVGLMTAGICVATAFSWFITSTLIPLVGFLIGRLIDVVLLFVLFKVLTREANRYRTIARDQFPHHLA